MVTFGFFPYKSLFQRAYGIFASSKYSTLFFIRENTEFLWFKDGKVYNQRIRSKSILFIKGNAKTFLDIIFIRICQRLRENELGTGTAAQEPNQKEKLKRDKHYVMFLKLPDHPQSRPSVLDKGTHWMRPRGMGLSVKFLKHWMCTSVLQLCSKSVTQM